MSHTFSDPFKDGKQKNLLELKTTVIYKRNPEKVTILDDTVSLDVIKNKNFTVTIRTQYSVTVVRDTDCAQMEKKSMERWLVCMSLTLMQKTRPAYLGGP